MPFSILDTANPSKRKGPAFGGAFSYVSVYKPNSVFASSANDSHLSGIVVADNLKRHFRIATDTALHTGKDFAVSSAYFYATTP